MQRRTLISHALLLSALATSALAARGADYPARPVTLIAPSGPGGGFDLIARLLADALSREMGGSFIVENRAGSGTLIGTQAAANAPADGYTLLVGGLSNLAFNTALYKRPGYNPKDFVPIGLVARYPYVLIARSDLAQNDAKQLVAQLRSHPDKLTIATAGPGSGQEVMASLFARTTGTKVVQIPYKAAAPAYQDLLAGRVDLFFDSLTTARTHIDAKRVKAMLVTSDRRSPLLPTVPTAREAGLAQLEMGTWFGLFARRAVPQPVLEQLRAGLDKVVRSPAFAQRLAPQGIEIMRLEPDATTRFIDAEYARWTALIRESGTTLD